MLKKSLFATVIILLSVYVSSAQVPQLINYQGLLADADCCPICGDLSIQFRIYEAETGGTALWTETQTVTVTDGIFSVLLGSVEPIPYSVFDGSDRYLSLQVASDPEMTPRKRLVSVGNAFRAYDSDKLDGQDASGFSQSTHDHDSRYYQQEELSKNDGVVNQSLDPVSWSKIKDMPAGFADGTDDGSAGGDNLGNHTATQNINLNGHWLSGDGGDEGAYINSAGRIGVGTNQPQAQLHVAGIDGVAFTGTLYSGTIPVEGVGARMMWYPRKAAFRAGYVEGSQWDDANIGLASIAMGWDAEASGQNSTAIGINTKASGHFSTAIGHVAEASGNNSAAFGYGAKATDVSSTAIGCGAEASGVGSMAIGYFTKAGGRASTAIGCYVSTAGDGSLIIGDYSTTTTLSKSEENRFYARFANGYYFYTDANASMGVRLPGGANSWSSLSDSTKKENFKAVDGEAMLKKISDFRLVSWNYKGQDPHKFRHYGPMAQNFYAAFGNDGIGTIGNDTTIASADFDGINFIAIQALEKRTDDLPEMRAKISELENTNLEFQKMKVEIEQLRNKILELENIVTSWKEADDVKLSNSK